jgi:hypothetical protein
MPPAPAAFAQCSCRSHRQLATERLDMAGPAEYFDIEVLHGQIVLTPMRIQRGDAVRAKLAAFGLTDADVADGPGMKRLRMHEVIPAAVDPTTRYWSG